MNTSTTAIAFAGDARIAIGDIRDVAAAVKRRVDRDTDVTILVFDVTTSERVEIDLRGTMEDVLGRLPAATEPEGEAEEAVAAPATAGRPKLGVVAREVTLLPRHWDWLATQPGGASVALRKLVDAARHANAEKDRIREAQESAYRFMTVMAGDRPGFQEAIRALFAGDRERLDVLIAPWPADVREHTRALASAAFGISHPQPPSLVLPVGGRPRNERGGFLKEWSADGRAIHDRV